MREKIWGVLAAGALGDAMGMPTECWSQEKIRQNFPNGVTELIASNENDVFGRKLAAGAITDDTLNVLMILSMIKKNQGQIRVADYITELREWNDNSPVSAFVSGPSTLKALDKIAQGVPIEKTGVTGTTNGASMKIAPIGIISDYRDLPALVKNVAEICLPTHNTTIAIAGASAVAAAISYTVRGGQSTDEIWSLAFEAINAAKTYGHDFPSASLTFRMNQARKILRQETDDQIILQRLYHEIGTGMETIETIPSAFVIVEMAKGDPLRASQLSASLGWDTDTIGAISAAICGGMNPKMPREIIRQIEEVNQLDFDQLAEELLPFVKEAK
ncbi:MAG: ADP-ribosylglycohydrolase family protein [Enterococcus sp.]|uniref:ADP-ribosylglycohydrolase family protein n=1 Tax=Enterococcus sp. TaxID=35783 RepID=UPI002649FEF4|nr:ADP-ribosylglycohydrolase family protein [Enterococcus sp.]MDN6003966.1 ADP-ribosylglycohydrolase family protein [Enterococcus sp.]MDN6217632.1 ADP-ribosylglycohydrolase family protein [Enterococcus sp.]MDN6561992.1 ADP-ribosylglycohydrolase family protein [Enterococcus sp.]MDN6584743.1 ADP-ribosylglycohydrolase family protein [Enterococcus sp.]MDN6616104.1 ADP-ribosylglycohydrolase family protein [Enterococcus sp.]